MVTLTLLCASPGGSTHGIAATFLPRTGPFQLSADVEVVRVAFGRFVRAGVRTRFEPRRSMPMRPGDGYGWRVWVRSRRPALHVEEELMLPTPPQSWGVSPAVRLWRDQRGATTTLSLDARTGLLENWWWFAKGDPVGRYTMLVRLEGVEIGKVVFEVQ